MSDPSRIRQVAENLLSNAIKFTDHGFIAFHAWLEDSKLLLPGERYGGAAIGPEERVRIYQEFCGCPSAEGVGGVGLGLSIVDRLVKLLGGTIELESEPGAGSRFVVSIPVETADSLPGGEESPREGERGFPHPLKRELRCLWVDDDPLQLRMTGGPVP